MHRPLGISAIATVFFLAAGFLAVTGAVMLGRPGVVSMALGAPLLNGLETAGPFMFLLVGIALAFTGWGLLRLHNWARRLALVVLVAGIVMLVPAFSAEAVDLRPSLIWGGLGIIVRSALLWYLWQASVSEQFRKVKDPG